MGLCVSGGSASTNERMSEILEKIHTNCLCRSHKAFIDFTIHLCAPLVKRAKCVCVCVRLKEKNVYAFSSDTPSSLRSFFSAAAIFGILYACVVHNGKPFRINRWKLPR